MADRVDLDEVRRLCEQASDGPWEVGVTYLTAGVARPGDRFAEPGKCAACHHGEPVWTGVADINGTLRDAHQHRVSLDVLGDPSVYGGPPGQRKGVVIQGGDDFGPNLSPQDAAFIAAARDLVPELAAEVERLRAELGHAITRANRNARLAADNADERDTATDRERERIANWFSAEADCWRIKNNTEAQCEYDHAAQMVRDLGPDGAR